MTRLFTNEANNAETGKKSAVRALQAWQYLISKAANRQIVKYDELKELMEYPTNKPLSSILGCIMHYCIQKKLPSLTIIVVNKKGIPGKGFTAEELENYHHKREKVFEFSWYKIVPPTIGEFRKAYIRGRAI